MPSLRRLTGWLAALAATGVIVALLLRAGSGADETSSTAPAVASPTGGTDVMKLRATRLVPEQAKAYAEKHRADAICLLALGRATGDPSWLERALAEHPDDPRVQLERWRLSGNLDEQMSAAEALRRLAPNNPLGTYLSMGLAFNHGDLGTVAGLLSEAEDRGGLETYGRDILLETQAVFKSGGLSDYDAWEAATGAADGLSLAVELRVIGGEIENLQHVFVQLGYWDEADYLFDQALSLGGQLEDGGLGIEKQMGLEFQRYFLMSFDPETIVSDEGTRARERVMQIQSAESVLYETWSNNDKRTLDAAGWEQYRAILRRDGESAAERWLRERK